MGGKRTFIDAFGPVQHLEGPDVAKLFSSESEWEANRQDYKRVKSSHVYNLTFGGPGDHGKPHYLLSFPMSPEEQTQVLEALKSNARDLFQIHEILSHYFYRHANRIAKKWRGMDDNARLDFFSGAMGPMARNHKTVATKMYETIFGETEKLIATRVTDWHLPTFNLEDLLSGDNALMFIQSRASSPPGMFRFADYEYCRNGRTMAVAYKRGDVPGMRFLLHREASDADSYITALFPRPQTAMRENEYELCSFSLAEAGQIVTLQRDTALIALYFCMKMLQGEIQGDMLDDYEELRPEEMEDYKRDIAHEGRTLEEHLSQAAYLNPLQALKVMLSVLNTRIVALQDHIWNLRDDPGYFLKQTRKYHEQRGGRLTAARGSSSVSARHLDPSDTLAFLCTGPASDLAVLHSLASQLVDVCQKHPSVAAPTNLDPAYAEALSKFLVSVIMARMKCESDLENHILSSGEFKRYFAFSSLDIEGPGLGTAARFASKKNSKTANALSLIGALWADYYFGAWRKFEVIRSIEKRASKDPKEPKLPENLRADLETWATLCVLERELMLHQPWITLANFHKVPAEPELEVARIHRMQREIHDLLSKRVDFRHQAYSPLIFTKYSRTGSLRSGRLTQDEKKQNMEVEQQHVAFWELVDNIVTSETGKKLDEHFGLDFSGHVPYRTSLDDELSQAKRAELMRKGISAAVQQTIFIGEDLDAPVQRSPTTGRAISAELRGAARSLRRSAQPQMRLNELPGSGAAGGYAAQEEVREPPATMFLKSKDLRKLSALFPAHEAEDRGKQARELSWADFVRIMKHVGFDVSNHADGSRVKFTPPESVVGGPYVTHMPHDGGQGSSKMDRGKARALGRDLTEKYGWTIDTFKSVSEKS